MHKGHVEKLEKAIELVFEVEKDAKREMNSSEYISYLCYYSRCELDKALCVLKKQVNSNHNN